MDKYNKLASNTIILALGQFSSKLLVIIMMRFYTRELGTSGYGSVSLIVNTSTLIMALVTLSVGESVIRFGLDEKTDKAQVFSISLLTNIIGLIIYIPFVPVIGMIDFLSGYSVLIYIYVFTASIRTTCALFVRSTGHVKLFAVDGIYNTIINIILNFILLSGFKLGILGYVLSVVLADSASIVFLFFMADLKKYIRIFGHNNVLRKAMYRFCIPMIPTTILWWITNVSDIYFITAMMSKSMAGIYSFAYKIPSIIAVISGIFSQAWNMSAITEKNSRTIARFYTEVYNFYSSVIYVIAAGMLLVIKPVLDFMSVDESGVVPAVKSVFEFMAVSESFKDAFRHTPFLILSVVFSCFSTFMGSMYVAAKKSVNSMLTAFGGALINVVLNFVLIPKMGLDGAALATFISYLIVFFLRVRDTRSIVFMDLKPVKMATNLILLSIMSAVVMLVENNYTFYLSLSFIFLLVVIINYKAGIAAINFVLKKKKHIKAN